MRMFKLLLCHFVLSVSLGASDCFSKAKDASSNPPQGLTGSASGRDTPLATPSSTNIAIIRSTTQILPRQEALRGLITAEQPELKGHGHPSVVNLAGTSYIAHVTVGTQTVPLLVDTGSSDLWVAPSSFECLDDCGRGTDQAACGFPALYRGTFSGGVVPDEYFSILYGNGQYLYGPYGFESVSLGGVTVPGQQIALPSGGYFRASTGDFAGLLGLAYPAMVPARRGRDPKPALNNSDEFAEHDTWLFRAVRQNLTQPMFSMALDIDGGGLLGIGEIVDVPVVGNLTSTAILMVNLVNETRAATDFTYYTIMADDYMIDGRRFSELAAEDSDALASPSFPAVVDSGWSTSVLPPSLVARFYAAFADPPRTADIGGGTIFTAPCGAAVPTFGVQIGTQVFGMARETILVSRLNATVNGTLVCGLGIQPGVEFAGVLGDTFLSNVVAVFDVGASEMRFGQRALGSLAGRDRTAGQDSPRRTDEL